MARRRALVTTCTSPRAATSPCTSSPAPCTRRRRAVSARRDRGRTRTLAGLQECPSSLAPEPRAAAAAREIVPLPDPAQRIRVRHGLFCLAPQGLDQAALLVALLTRHRGP